MSPPIIPDREVSINGKTFILKSAVNGARPKLGPGGRQEQDAAGLPVYEYIVLCYHATPQGIANAEAAFPGPSEPP